MVEVIDVLKSIGAGILVLGLIHFIIINLFKNLNFKRRALVSLITGAILSVLISAGVAYDYFVNKTLISFNDGALVFFYYYSFLIVSLSYMIILPIIFFIIGQMKNQAFRDFRIKVEKNKKKEKMNYTINEKYDYVYVVVKYNNSFLLKEVNGSFSTIIERLRGNYLFHDDMIRHIIDEYNLESDIRVSNMYQLMGRLCVLGDPNDKKSFDKTYYCYVVNVDRISDKLKGYEEVDVYSLLNYNLSNLDKQILYRVVMGNSFEVEMKEEEL